MNKIRENDYFALQREGGMVVGTHWAAGVVPLPD